MNPWKWIVIIFVAHKSIKLTKKLIKAKRLANKKIKLILIQKYDDL